MPQYKFSCPNCGQHFAGDFGYCGLQMTCPACQKEFIVPSPGSSAPVAGPSAPRAQRTTVALPAKLPLRPPTAATAAPVAPKTSALAVASLVCSLGSLLIFPLFIPGIVCGHMALSRLKKDPTLRGRNMAKTGLIVGYVVLALGILMIIAIVAFGISYFRLVKP